MLRDKFGKFIKDTKWNRFCIRCRSKQTQIKLAILGLIIVLAIYEITV